MQIVCFLMMQLKCLFQRKGEVLFHCLDCVDKLDGCKKGLIIDVDLAIQEAKKYEDVSDLW